MIGYFFLLLSMSIIWKCAVKRNRNEYLKPSSLIPLLQIISIGSAIIGFLSWNSSENDIIPLTYCIVICSTLSALFGCGVADKYRVKINNKDRKGTVIRHLNSSPRNEDKEYSIRIPIFLILLLIEIVLFYLYYHYLTITYGTTSIRTLIYYGHESYFWPSLVKNSTAQKVARYCFKVIKGIAFAFIFVLAHNYAVKGRIRVLFTIPIIVYLMGWFLDGSRHNIMLTILAIIMLAYIISKKHNNLIEDHISLKSKLLILIGAICIAAFFWGSSVFWAKNNSNPLAYGSFTFGCSIPTMNKALITNQGFNDTRSFGATTFRGLYDLLKKTHLISEYHPSTKGWSFFVDKTGTEFASNTFSAAYNLYFDFGFLGMVVISAFEGWFYEMIYNAAKKAKENQYLPMIILAFFLPCLFNWFRTEDLISSNLIELSTYILVPFTAIIIKTCFKRLDSST